MSTYSVAVTVIVDVEALNSTEALRKAERVVRAEMGLYARIPQTTIVARDGVEGAR